MPAPTIDNNAGNAGGAATNTATFTLATSQNNVVIVACIEIENNGGAAPAVSSITGGSLNWALRKAVTGPTGGRSEMWWAPAPSTLGSTTFTVLLAGTTDAFAISAFGVKGCSNIINPWDSNSGNPVTDQHAGSAWTPSVTFTTNQANDFLIYMVGADANFAAGTTVASGYTAINRNFNSHLNFAQIVTSFKAVTATQSGVTQAWGSALTPTTSGQAIFDALTADVTGDITIRAVSTGPNNLATSSTINLPSGTTTNDLTVIVGGQNVSSFANAVTIPAGWTTIGNAMGMFACYRKFVALDPSSVTFNSSQSAFWETVAVSFIGCDTTTPVDVFNTYFEQLVSDRGLSVTAQSVAPKFNNDLLLTCFVDGTSLGDSQSVPSGFAALVTSAGGPSTMITQKQLRGAAQTGIAVSTNQRTNQPKAAFTLALHASGDTAAVAAAPIMTIGGIYNVSPVATTITVPLSQLGAQQNDLTCVVACPQGSTFASPPAGWTQQALANNIYTFTRAFQNGDADPVFTAGGSVAQSLIAVVLRATNFGVPVIDQVHTATGTGSATLATQTPAHANEYLFAAWGQNSASGDTWTPSASLTQEALVTNGPSLLVQDIQPAAVPTGTFTATASGGTHAVGAAGILITPPSGSTPTPGVMASLIL
jgi:hypothetical protein